MEADFSGYATKAGILCTDGRTIMPNAFKENDGVRVPLVWQHGHNDPANVLGHAILENREDGVYAYGFFNDTKPAQTTKALVQHGDITMMSIYANQLVERAKQVFHGMIREVSLVLSAANSGAQIDFVSLQHSDGSIEVLDDEAIIFTGLTLEHSSSTPDKATKDERPSEPVENAAGAAPTEQNSDADSTEDSADENDQSNDEISHSAEDPTVEEILSTLNEEQSGVVNYLLGVALATAKAANPDNAAAHSDESSAANANGTTDEDSLTHQEGTEEMSRNVFEQNGLAAAKERPHLTHDQLTTIVNDAQKLGSFKESFLMHAGDFGIDDIDILFPDAKTVTSQPELIARRTEWVAGVIDGAKHSPFARIKSTAADLTAEAARAKGYVKGNKKKDEVIRLLKRVTIPTTIYKKQKLDRDDVVDITDLDVVAWLKWEMRFMLEEEIARAILIGDGREPDDPDKIDEEKLRPIAWDDEMYAHSVTVPADISADGTIESIIRARKYYKGTGTPSFYTTDDILTDMLLVKDKMGRRIYNNESELAQTLRVSGFVTVEVMEDTPDLLGILVNIADYTIGADKGGAISMFDDFDIDYNQLKYLMETRISGALTKPKSAVVVKRTSGTTVTPTAPAYNEATHQLTVPSITGVNYFDVTDPLNEVALTDGATVTITKTTDVEARPEAGYNFPHNTDADWTFAYTA